ncbi:MAG: hypothetical protein KBG40_00935 [Bacteroidales bacterium]|nr:hypothetical protein [Bacteroidales bacterium]
MRRFILSFFSIFILSPYTLPQDVRVKASFDSTKIYIGDHVRYIITFDKPKDLPLTLPIFKDTLIKQIEILKGPNIDSSFLSDNYIRIKHEYLVTSFDSGFYQVPPVYAELKSDSGIRRFYSDYVWLQVMRVEMTPPDTTSAIFDIVDPARVPVTAGEVIPWILLALFIGVLIWLAIKIIKRRKKEGPSMQVIRPSEPAHVIAFRELEKLKSEKLWEKGEIKKYYARLTEIIRQYIMNRYSVPALEMTTSETLQALLLAGVSKDENYMKLRKILTEGDLVKFAKYKPEPSENELIFKYAWDYIKSTMVTEQPSETEKETTDSSKEEINE